MGDSFGDILLIVGSAALGAVGHKVATEEVHQRDVREAYNKGFLSGAFRQSEIDRQLMRAKDAEIARLNGIVESQAKALSQQLKARELNNGTNDRKLLPPGT